MIIQTQVRFYGFKEQAHLSVISLVSLQTYIFTDGEDAELKKKIGKFHEGNRDAHCFTRKGGDSEFMRNKIIF